jgi:hypothetical protein
MKAAAKVLTALCTVVVVIVLLNGLRHAAQEPSYRTTVEFVAPDSSGRSATVRFDVTNTSAVIDDTPICRIVVTDAGRTIGELPETSVGRYLDVGVTDAFARVVPLTPPIQRSAGLKAVVTCSD